MTVVDAKHAELHIHDQNSEALEQIAQADVIVLNKVDMVTADLKDTLAADLVKVRLDVYWPLLHTYTIALFNITILR